METINSSSSKAFSNFFPFGVDKTGFPAVQINIFICPSPSVKISSARVATGNSPEYSGKLCTLLLYLSKFPTFPCAPDMKTKSMAGLVNIAPPTLSILLVTIFKTLINH